MFELPATLLPPKVMGQPIKYDCVLSFAHSVRTDRFDSWRAEGNPQKMIGHSRAEGRLDSRR